ncbi:MAG: erythromycin esterase family protein [Bacteroidetes bacterium]|nr:erythromycin esterase family protein [Bacteroidota bacterium]
MKNHSRIFIILIFFLSGLSCPLPAQAPAMYAIDTTASEPYNFLDTLLEGKRVVALGEISHGDGSTFQEKTSLIKYLHDKLGFRVILFESSFVQMELMNRNHFITDSLTGNLFSIWKNVNETQALFRFMKAGKMILSGFDCQYYRNRYHIEDSVCSIYASKIEALKPASDFRETLRVLCEHYGTSATLIPKKDQKECLMILNALILEQTDTLQEHDSFWNQVLVSMYGYARASWEKDIMKANYIRDQYMADNLLWLLNHSYAGEKVIVWAATEHICTNQVMLYKQKQKEGSKDFYKTGDFLRESLHEKLFTISFIYDHGSTLWAGDSYHADRAGNTLEKSLAEKYSKAFVVTKYLQPCVVNGTETNQLYGSKYADWKLVCDGFYFISNMQVSTPMKK